jgi:hypothetical protein
VGWACSMYEREALVGRPRCRCEALVKVGRNIQILQNAGNSLADMDRQPVFGVRECREFPLHREAQTGSGPPSVLSTRYYGLFA